MNGYITSKIWADRLRAQSPLHADPRFPDRPRSGFFDVLSRIVRATDSFSAQLADAIGEMTKLVGGDEESLNYMTTQRGLRLMRSAALSDRMRSGIGASQRFREDVLTMFRGAWIDGFITGALYGNQNPTIGRVTLDEKENDDGSTDD